ncbi:MAG: hypothetical protein M5U09_18665 [Gammaproteobacteria bacterium]|nr:hypothetical protein [Gammaproteobacteria bacterium]
MPLTVIVALARLDDRVLSRHGPVEEVQAPGRTRAANLQRPGADVPAEVDGEALRRAHLDGRAVEDHRAVDDGENARRSRHVRIGDDRRAEVEVVLNQTALDVQGEGRGVEDTQLSVTNWPSASVSASSRSGPLTPVTFLNWFGYSMRRPAENIDPGIGGHSYLVSWCRR